jgi:hypothetical protein
MRPIEYFEIDVKQYIENPLSINLPPEIQIDDYVLVRLENLMNLDYLFNSLIEPINDLIKVNHYYNNRFFRIKHKLKAISYHYGNYCNRENFLIEAFKRDRSVRKSDAYFEIWDEIIVYEIEGFLFQIKSYLDIIGNVIGYLFNWNDIKRYEKKGDIFIEKAKNNCTKDKKMFCADLINLINKHKTWTTNLIDMRDLVTHFSDLDGLCCFITYFSGKSAKDKAKVYYPVMPHGERVIEYMKKTWNNVLSFLNDFVLLFKAMTKR